MRGQLYCPAYSPGVALRNLLEALQAFLENVLHYALQDPCGVPDTGTLRSPLGGEAPKDFTKPQQTIESPDRQ